ncbi:iron chelate uptake ABC transporter family permease subunit [Nocardioides panacisoli]|uniref:iron chelate uptake ABC transporter family permease subunit n=1 Tax=Nocardioides panacisoli TaxID=627624 RepID=UPI001C635C0B|nr:iron chelate uptake ABC transporter family permease subunit [Nocardioides panacisoli]QYJ02799.1 iron chelate uptake ABC transporter family permease subunit [Nocardioides panacisoli]
MPRPDAPPHSGATTVDAAARSRPAREVVVLTALGAVLVGAVVLFLTWDVGGYWEFALPRRAEQLAALAVVGVAVAVSTVVFHTLTQNRILTPSIMGFDALYVLLATSLVFFLGGTEVATMSDLTMFGLTTALLVGAATLLYRWVLGDGSRGLYTLVLVGVIAGTLFGSLSDFLYRVMDPNEYDVLLSDLYAGFNRIDTEVLWVAAALLVPATIVVFSRHATLDVLTLGRERAIALGIDHRRELTLMLMVVTVLVATSTALVGPIVFLGLLVANLAYQLTRTHRHLVNLAAASLVAVIALVLGQGVLEHVLGFTATLPSIINLVGGAHFVALLVKESRS